MPFILDTPKSIAKTIEGFEINSFALDLDRNELIIAYDQLDADGVSVGLEQVITIDGEAYVDALTRVSEIAGADVYAALKQGMYEQITDVTGATGVVS